MTSFESKKISQQKTLGEILRETRESLALNLKQAAKNLRINAVYLEYLEEGKYDKLPADIYTSNFVKAYAQSLNLDIDRIISIYNFEYKLFHQLKNKKDHSFATEKISILSLLSLPKLIRNFVIAGAIIACLAYLGLQIKQIYEPPLLEISEPKDNLITKDPLITIKGQVSPDTKLFINNQEKITNIDGTFTEDLDLQNGVNTIKILAVKKHGEETVIYRQVMVEAPIDIEREINTNTNKPKK